MTYFVSPMRLKNSSVVMRDNLADVVRGGDRMHFRLLACRKVEFSAGMVGSLWRVASQLHVNKQCKHLLNGLYILCSKVSSHERTETIPTALEFFLLESSTFRHVLQQDIHGTH